ncbi:hypothetical protein ACFU99_02560 [Streptomyces sp. NPDC057654]|uniref:hypothetical protein n=1 Tax=Streptomyces sp. NPDC057654 TaxID=3346196 RepID=UPI0036CC6A16
MVSSSHEAMHRIFQEDPGIFSRTFRALGIPFGDPVAVSLLPTDLTETKPLERRVDTLLRFDTAEDDGFLLLVEAQGKRDSAKPASWAYYLAHLWSKYGTPPVLLVVCQDKTTAAWASGPFTIGPAQWPALTLRPLVLGPHNVPVITDVSVAARDIPLATLSAITHGREPNADAILKALASALKTADQKTARIFIELTELGLGEAPAAQTWRDLMAADLSFFRSVTSQNLRAEGLATAVLFLLDQRGIDVSDEARKRITDCHDHETLITWLARVYTTESTADLFEDDEA